MASTSKRSPFRSGVRWYSLWDAEGKRAGYERHVVSAVSDGSATIETLSVYKAPDGHLSEGTTTLAFGTGGQRVEAVRASRDNIMGFSIRRSGDMFNGHWLGKPFNRPLPADFLPNFGLAEYVATLPQEQNGFWGFARLPMGSDVPAPASIECVGEEEIKVGSRIYRAWKYVERVGNKPKTQWWIDKDRVVVKVNFGLVAHLEDNEAAARTEVTVPFPAPRPPMPQGGGIAGFDDPTRLLVEIPKNPVAARPSQAQSPAPAPPPAPAAPAPAAAAVNPPTRPTAAPGAPAAAAAIDRPSSVRIEHILPRPGPAPSPELGQRATFKKAHRWYSLSNNGQPAGWECHMVNPSSEGALVETEVHYKGPDNVWHESSAVVVFTGGGDVVANCHFMQDGVQTELGQPFFTLRRLDTGFIGTWQGKPYKRALPNDFVPGFGLHEWIATLPQSPGWKKTVQRLAMAQTEVVPSSIECHGEQETQIRGETVKLCKFVERIADKVRAVWWIDRDRVIRKHFFGLEAILEESEAVAKERGKPPE